MEIPQEDKVYSKPRKGIYIIPNLLTTGNIFCGFYAIVSSINGNFYNAAVAIMIAMVFDCLDGKVARLTNTSSDFGLNYDSLADIISFGMAPGLLIYLWVLKPFGRIGWMAAFLYLICGALRLARFNSQAPTTEETDFIGLPIPPAAGVVASLVILLKDIFFITRTPPMLMAFLVYILAFLMVSNIKYKSFKKLELTKQKTFNILIFAILLTYIVATLPQLMLFLIIIAYVLSGPLTTLWAQLSPLKKLNVVEPKE